MNSIHEYSKVSAVVNKKKFLVDIESELYNISNKLYIVIISNYSVSLYDNYTFSI